MGDGFISGRTALASGNLEGSLNRRASCAGDEAWGKGGAESTDCKFVYYSKGFDIAEIWKVPAGGGDETLILKGPIQGKWSVLADGIYFIAIEPAPTVKFYGFTTRPTKDLASVGKGITWTDQGFSVSPDGKQLPLSHVRIWWVSITHPAQT